jgi:Transcriptional regulator/sugar kinase
MSYPNISGSATTGYVVGVDLGGTKIRAAVADLNGEILADQSIPTSHAEHSVTELIHDLVAALCAEAGVSAGEILATGVGGAGVPDLSADGFSRAPNLDLGGTGFMPSLARVLGHHVVLENDVNVAAIGELHYGIGRQHHHFVCISIGTGIGMGIVVDGHLLTGAHGGAGEIGYLPIGDDPLDPANHRRGPLEEVLAGDRFAARYGDVDAQTVFDKAESGDESAIASIDTEAKWLAHAIVAVNAVLDTEAVVLTGGIGGRVELLDRTTRWLARLGEPTLPVLHSGLGQDAAIAGAIRLALDSLGTEPTGELR